MGLTIDPGNTLLMLAAYSGHADLTQSLVSRGADVDRVNDRGQTPLAGAVFKGHNEVVRVLRSAGANSRLGVPTAIQAARMFNRREMLDTLGASEGDMEEAVPLPIPPPPTGA
ncbi:hypothetical protein NLI96_g9902 [Meripilus lineatus]|uniref:Ankyrin repeat protein n=1 Tax=Meripilus lineatus TaxID=2056292 RepID=A0AAD5UWB7_9APHY|nr:hypothetical protein NLI96_g9902 [Physisporinus lineatus]